MLNINIGHNRQLFDKCKILWEYSMFISEARKYIKEKKEIVAGVKKAVEECIKNNILKEFLKEKESSYVSFQI